MATPALIPVKLTKPMWIGDAPEIRPAGFIHNVSPQRALRWIATGLAIDPSGKIAPPPPDEKSKAKGKKARGEDDEGDGE
jgi:hypothetical protein